MIPPSFVPAESATLGIVDKSACVSTVARLAAPLFSNFRSRPSLHPRPDPRVGLQSKSQNRLCLLQTEENLLTIVVIVTLWRRSFAAQGAIGFYDRPQPGVSGIAKRHRALFDSVRRVRKGNGGCRLVLSPNLRETCLRY